MLFKSRYAPVSPTSNFLSISNPRVSQYSKFERPFKRKKRNEPIELALKLLEHVSDLQENIEPAHRLNDILEHDFFVYHSKLKHTLINHRKSSGRLYLDAHATLCLGFVLQNILDCSSSKDRRLISMEHTLNRGSTTQEDVNKAINIILGKSYNKENTKIAKYILENIFQKEVKRRLAPKLLLQKIRTIRYNFANTEIRKKINSYNVSKITRTPQKKTIYLKKNNRELILELNKTRSSKSKFGKEKKISSSHIVDSTSSRYHRVTINTDMSSSLNPTDYALRVYSVTEENTHELKNIGSGKDMRPVDEGELNLALRCDPEYVLQPLLHFQNTKIKCQDWYKLVTRDYLVYELSDGDMKDQSEHIAKDPITFAKQLLECVNNIHTHHIAHCDIKPQNILTFFKKKHGGIDQIKLTDFDLSVDFELKNFAIDSSRGTPIYMAPEIYENNTICERSMIDFQATDLWSTGAVLFELFTSKTLFEFLVKKPYSANAYKDLTQKKIDKLIKKTFSNRDPIMKEMLLSLLQLDPAKRTLSNLGETFKSEEGSVQEDMLLYNPRDVSIR